MEEDSPHRNFSDDGFDGDETPTSPQAAWESPRNANDFDTHSPEGENSPVTANQSANQSPKNAWGEEVVKNAEEEETSKNTVESPKNASPKEGDQSPKIMSPSNISTEHSVVAELREQLANLTQTNTELQKKCERIADLEARCERIAELESKCERLHELETQCAKLGEENSKLRAEAASQAEASERVQQGNADLRFELERDLSELKEENRKLAGNQRREIETTDKGTQTADPWQEFESQHGQFVALEPVWSALSSSILEGAHSEFPVIDNVSELVEIDVDNSTLIKAQMLRLKSSSSNGGILFSREKVEFLQNFLDTEFRLDNEILAKVARSLVIDMLILRWARENLGVNSMPDISLLETFVSAALHILQFACEQTHPITSDPHFIVLTCWLILGIAEGAINSLATNSRTSSRGKSTETFTAVTHIVHSLTVHFPTHAASVPQIQCGYPNMDKNLAMSIGNCIARDRTEGTPSKRTPSKPREISIREASHDTREIDHQIWLEIRTRIQQHCLDILAAELGLTVPSCQILIRLGTCDRLTLARDLVSVLGGRMVTLIGNSNSTSGGSGCNSHGMDVSVEIVNSIIEDTQMKDDASRLEEDMPPVSQLLKQALSVLFHNHVKLTFWCLAHFCGLTDSSPGTTQFNPDVVCLIPLLAMRELHKMLSVTTLSLQDFLESRRPRLLCLVIKKVGITHADAQSELSETCMEARIKFSEALMKLSLQILDHSMGNIQAVDQILFSVQNSGTVRSHQAVERLLRDDQATDSSNREDAEIGICEIPIMRASDADLTWFIFFHRLEQKNSLQFLQLLRFPTCALIERLVRFLDLGIQRVESEGRDHVASMIFYQEPPLVGALVGEDEEEEDGIPVDDAFIPHFDNVCEEFGLPTLLWYSLGTILHIFYVLLNHDDVTNKNRVASEPRMPTPLSGPSNIIVKHDEESKAPGVPDLLVENGFMDVLLLLLEEVAPKIGQNVPLVEKLKDDAVDCMKLILKKNSDICVFVFNECSEIKDVSPNDDESDATALQLRIACDALIESDFFLRSNDGSNADSTLSTLAQWSTRIVKAYRVITILKGNIGSFNDKTQSTATLDILRKCWIRLLERGSSIALFLHLMQSFESETSSLMMTRNNQPGHAIGGNALGNLLPLKLELDLLYASSMIDSFRHPEETANVLSLIAVLVDSIREALQEEYAVAILAVLQRVLQISNWHHFDCQDACKFAVQKACATAYVENQQRKQQMEGGSAENLTVGDNEDTVRQQAGDFMLRLMQRFPVSDRVANKVNSISSQYIW